MENGLYIELENGDSVMLESTCYCVFIDETGAEALSDPRYPIFGFGGCGILVAHYKKWLMLPWRRMKQGYFGDADIAIHAADIRPGIQDFDKKVEGLNIFFGNGPYDRIASICTSSTEIENSLPALQELAIEVCRSQIYKASAPWEPTKIAVIIESCERTNLAVASYFMKVDKAIASYADGRSVEVKIEIFFARKSVGLEGLEVADFIIHTAGTTCRDVISKGIKPSSRPDFAMTFGSHHPSHIVHFKLNTKVNSA